MLKADFSKNRLPSQLDFLERGFLSRFSQLDNKASMTYSQVETITYNIALEFAYFSVWGALACIVTISYSKLKE